MKEYPKTMLENTRNFKKGEYWFSPFNQLPETTKGLPETVRVHDVTLRDGEQTPGLTFLEDERGRIAELLDSIGVDRIEGGFPSVSDVQYRALKRIAHAGLKRSKVFGFGFAREQDAKLIIDAGCEGAVIEHSVNPLICEKAYRLTPEEIVKRVAAPIAMTKKAGLYTSFMAWDWFRAPLEFTKWLLEALLNEVELDGVIIVDTFGNSTPEAVYYVVSKFHEWFPQIALEFHGHNDHGLGVACAVQAMKAGAKVIHTSMNGIGDRAGNVPLEQFIVDAQHYYGMNLQYNLKAINDASSMISKFAKIPVAPNQPIIGERPYQIEGGTLTDLILKMEEPLGFGPMSSYPSLIGRPGDIQVLLGKNVGVSGIRIMLRKYGLTATEEQAKELAARVKAEGLLTKDIVSEDRFLKMYHEIVK